MTFEKVWEKLKAEDTTGTFAMAEKLSLVSVEAIEYAFNSGYAEGLKAERPQGEWIPVSERLPEAVQTVLVTSKGGYVYTSCIVHGEWEYGGEVIAWQPLPEPYKAEMRGKEE